MRRVFFLAALGEAILTGCSHVGPLSHTEPGRVATVYTATRVRADVARVQHHSDVAALAVVSEPVWTSATDGTQPGTTLGGIRWALPAVAVSPAPVAPLSPTPALPRVAPERYVLSIEFDDAMSTSLTHAAYTVLSRIEPHALQSMQFSAYGSNEEVGLKRLEVIDGYLQRSRSTKLQPIERKFIRVQPGTARPERVELELTSTQRAVQLSLAPYLAGGKQ